MPVAVTSTALPARSPKWGDKGGSDRGGCDGGGGDRGGCGGWHSSGALLLFVGPRRAHVQARRGSGP
ncbi:MAG: hypothetical protein EOS04_19980 [Mesorhizobium sp.]|nr:MAG: hypothetical protein EOR98_12650 [Mesorhizobium sp.]RWN77211.1 MAG: hypothetical protein EOS02_11845 [Mesorhizobium sp.]RWN80250.1 MAG: hypothetical protein EOS01_12715 [Mesorhizobium sp.]RWN86163.1 MAG: hypothetical protein EOS04_19980 [Mesorhizobium sp.]RWO14947.1 MAG: hypothetical protein EOS15_11620 [Mesorhizobium sp.]